MGHTKCVQNVMLVSQNAQLNCLASVLICERYSSQQNHGWMEPQSEIKIEKNMGEMTFGGGFL